MVDYIVTQAHNAAFVEIGDYLRSTEGTYGVFEGVAGEDPEGGGMLILVSGNSEYAAYWNVYVDEIAEEPDFDEWAEEWRDNNEDPDYEDDFDYAGYDVRDEYYADLYGEDYC